MTFVNILTMISELLIALAVFLLILDDKFLLVLGPIIYSFLSFPFLSF
jgi:hypothetical protein